MSLLLLLKPKAAAGGTFPIGLISETDTAFAVTGAKSRSIGLISETDSAFAFGKAKALTIGQGFEVDFAFAVSGGVEVIKVWVSYARVWRFKEVRRTYMTTTAFKNAVETEIRGSQVWARWKPGMDPWTGSSNMQVDTRGIPGVPPLRDNGIPYL